MKRNNIIYVVIILLLVLMVGCGEGNQDKGVTINCENKNVMIGETVSLGVTSNKKDAKFTYEVDGTSVEIRDGKIITKEAGQSIVTIKIEGTNINKEVVINVMNEGLTIVGKKTVVIETETELELLMNGIDEDEKVTWKSSDIDVARVSKGVVTGIALGKATITAKSGDYVSSFDIEVIRPIATGMEVEDNVKFEIGAEYKLDFTVSPGWALQEVVVESDSDLVKIDSEGCVTALKEGTLKLDVYAKSNREVKKEVNVSIMKNETPKFELGNDYEESLTINWNDFTTFLTGIKAIDNADGDITDKIEFDLEDALKYGERVIKLSITDRAGNVATMDRHVNVKWPYHVKFIGHSGSYLGVPNSEEAFLEAARTLHYQALECDLHITKDGVFVTNHDSTIKDKETGEEFVIEDCTYDVIKNVTTGYSTMRSHVCLFERYLEICKEYGLEAIVELKWTTGIVPSNQSNLPKLVELIKSKGMWENTVFLSSMEECLAWFRNNGYKDVKLQVLKSTSDSQATLDFCKKYNVDLSINVTYSQYESTDEWLKKYHDANLEISTWTFSDTSEKGYKAIQTWIDKGVEYVTCDNHHIDKLTLPLE